MVVIAVQKKVYFRQTSPQTIPTINISTFHQFVYNSKQKGVTVCQYMNSEDSNTFFLAMSENQSITLPPHVANNVPINRKEMTEIRKLVAYVPQHDETEDMWNKISQWPTVDGE
jgi:hypothetical protein